MIKAIEEGKEYPSKKPHPRVLDPYKEQIIKWMEESTKEFKGRKNIS